MNYSKCFAHRVVSYRKQIGLSQSQLAKNAGISAAALSKIEEGETDPRLSTVCAISQALNIPVDELAGVGTFPQPEIVLRQQIAMLNNKILRIKDIASESR